MMKPVSLSARLSIDCYEETFDAVNRGHFLFSDYLKSRVLQNKE